MDDLPEQDPVARYYGEKIRTAADLQTGVCTCREPLPAAHRAILATIDAEILDRFYGCGSPIPPAIEGATVLDLGCGCGRDVFLLSKLVGPNGRVIGVDLLQSQLDIAERHREDQARRFGHPRSNVEFRRGRIEDLGAIGIADGSVDVVVSNCVINLSRDKDAIFREVRRVLKPGGEFLFADVFADRRLPAEMRRDAVLIGECLGGALYTEDFRRAMEKAGFADHRVVSTTRSEIGDQDIAERIGNIVFSSDTVRAFKLDDLEDRCEDYGQVAIYLGTIPDHPNGFALDDHHRFETGRPMLVCGNTAAMVSQTRYASHFRLIGDRTVHFGAFDCGGGTRQARDGETSCGC